MKLKILTCIVCLEIVLSAILVAALANQWYGLPAPPANLCGKRPLLLPETEFSPRPTLTPQNSPSCKSTRTNSTRKGFATWYSRASAHREGTGGKRILMANGKPLVDTAMTAAMNTPGKPSGQRYRVTNCDNGMSVTVRHEDKGPGKKAAKRGVIIDLTPAAFLALGGKLNNGKLTVKVEAIK